MKHHLNMFGFSRCWHHNNDGTVAQTKIILNKYEENIRLYLTLNDNLLFGCENNSNENGHYIRLNYSLFSTSIQTFYMILREQVNEKIALAVLLGIEHIQQKQYTQTISNKSKWALIFICLFFFCSFPQNNKNKNATAGKRKNCCWQGKNNSTDVSVWGIALSLPIRM